MIKRRWIWWAIVFTAMVVMAVLRPQIPITPGTAFSALAAQSFCLPHDTMVRYLAVAHGRNVAAMGVVENFALIEVFVNAETAAFSVVFTDTTGGSCLIWNGGNWRTLYTGAI